MEQLTRALMQLQGEAAPALLERFKLYREEILRWNEKVNLTAITQEEEFVKKHFVDSLLCLDYPEFQEAERIIDVGTGAGFPGIPLALCHPEKQFLLMDSLGKRIKILEEICGNLGITNVALRHGRAEELAREQGLRESFDLCVSRAVAKLSVLSEYCLPFVRPGGTFIAYKTDSFEEELSEARRALGILGGNFSEARRPALSGFDLSHSLLLIEKVGKTPEKYPRKAGTPAKEPLN